jgi:8-oxo-dGTP diphosphatase
MTRREIHVTAALVRRGGRLLAAQRPEGETRGGCWEFPGGKIEVGESPEGCLARELHEELALEVSVRDHYLSVTHDYPDVRVHLHAYLCEVAGGTPTPLEHQRIRWLSPQELPALSWSEADRPIVEKLIAEQGRTP